ncbi:ABC transporter ATP-binding protein [Metallosphaera tengchongensis]|uniref:ABC transporter ATP-binding protein n=1 Tax=Metallosphaera tengchongensis TaxID=1532350 RepID=A0A6N0NSU2_9CREN|nr:ABC transporter ATP-binding protein [Metallosphaera tengchongensis]QKQ99771.1 ABC transporter ATP-binding protein [Metallosphaera tengchongensis]
MSKVQTKEKVLEVQDLKLSFYTRRGVYHALRGVDLNLYPGEVLGLAGESGSGKSTLGLTIMGLIPRNARLEDGSVKLDGIDVVQPLRDYGKNTSKFSVKKNEKIIKKLNKQLQQVRGNKISMVFQEPLTALNPVLPVGYQIAEAVYFHDPDRLLRRALSRDKVTQEDMREFLNILKTDGEEKLIQELKSRGLEGLDEQILSVWRRKDIHEARKEKIVLSLANVKLKSIDKLGLTIYMHGLHRFPILSRFAKNSLINEGYRLAVEILTFLGIPHPEKVVKLYPHELSGGMRQRVVISIALANNPKIVIMDEPTSALDVTIQAQILDLVKDLKGNSDISFIFISHDLSVLAEVSDRIGIMYAGKLVEIGPVSEIFQEPLHPYTRMLMEAIPGMDKSVLKTIPGSVPDMRNPPTGCAFSTRCPFAIDRCRTEDPRMVEVSKDHQVACWLVKGGGRHAGSV